MRDNTRKHKDSLTEYSVLYIKCLLILNIRVVVYVDCSVVEENVISSNFFRVAVFF